MHSHTKVRRHSSKLPADEPATVVSSETADARQKRVLARVASALRLSPTDLHDAVSQWREEAPDRSADRYLGLSCRGGGEFCTEKAIEVDACMVGRYLRASYNDNKKVRA